MTVLDELDIDVSFHGDVGEENRVYALDKLAAVARLTTRPVLAARLRLVMEPDPARERPAVVQGALDLDGRVVRAHVAAPTMREAIDRFENRLRERVERVEDRPQASEMRHRDAGPGEWHHGDVPARRPDRFERPVEEREVVTRKEFALAAETPDEAVFDMECLDHDFLLFTNADTNEENVVSRSLDGGYEIMQPTATPDELARGAAPIRLSKRVPATLRLEDALELLNLADEPFVFFVDAASGRGEVAYRRYDGHYGLIVPAA